MKETPLTDRWYYVIVLNPGTASEELVGFVDTDSREKFLPAFKTRQDAESCFHRMPKNLFTETYDVHAVIEEDILLAAQKSGHRIFLMDESGSILKHLNPAGPPA